MFFEVPCFPLLNYIFIAMSMLASTTCERRIRKKKLLEIIIKKIFSGILVIE